MQAHTVRAALAAVAIAAALAGCGGTDQGEGTAQAGDGGDWALPNADVRNTRRVGGPIDAASVGRLRVAWTAPIAGVVANPIVADGVVYVQDVSSDLSAFALADGRQLWRRIYAERSVGPNGVAVVGGRLYGATATAAFAHDARTGRPLWLRRLVANDHEGIDMAPGVWGGTVYVSTVPVNHTTPYGPGGRGVLWALDAADGRPRWRWATVPEDLWGRPDVNSGGGLWYPPAFDGHGQLFAAVGNPGPWSGTPRHPWGASRPGPNRWTNSLVKLDARTGRMAWGRQVLPHDLYDWDLQCPPILVQVDGRPIVVAAGKMGFVYAFDQRDGRLLWKRSVGVHNGHDDDGRRTMAGGDGGLKSPERVLPGQLGGVETQMAADDDSVYVPVENLYSIYRAGATGDSGPLERGSGEVVALELASGRVKWVRKLPASAWGATTIANDLVFTPTIDGTVWALRTDDGTVAWKASLPAGSNAPLAIAGDTLIAAAGVPSRAGQTPALVAYRLGD